MVILGNGPRVDEDGQIARYIYRNGRARYLHLQLSYASDKSFKIIEGVQSWYIWKATMNLFLTCQVVRKHPLDVKVQYGGSVDHDIHDFDRLYLSGFCHARADLVPLLPSRLSLGMNALHTARSTRSSECWVSNLDPTLSRASRTLNCFANRHNITKICLMKRCTTSRFVSHHSIIESATPQICCLSH